MGVIGCIPMPRAGSLEAVRVRRRCRAFFSSTFCPFFFPFPSTDCHGLRKWREFVEVQWNWEDLGQKGGREAFMGKRIVVLGGGTAGTMVANRLARRLMDSIRSGELEILLITRSGRHVYQPGLLSVVFSEAFPEQIVREEKSLVHRDVTLVFDEIRRIRPDQSCVQSRTTEYPYDYLVIATGSRPDFDGVPGLKESARHFYNLEGALRLRDALASMKKGRILVVVEHPHKGPGAPVEFVLMLDDYLRRRGLREGIQLTYAFSDGRIHFLEPVADWALSQFERRGIAHQPFF